MFSISNVLIQSSVNSFGSVAMAGNTAGSNVEGFVYTSMNSVHQTAVSFTGQNLGGKKYDRINKILIECLLFVTAIGLIMGNGAFSLENKFLVFILQIRRWYPMVCRGWQLFVLFIVFAALWMFLSEVSEGWGMRLCL